MPPNQMLINDQSDTNWEPIWRQLRPNLMPSLMNQSDVNLIWTNLVPIEVKNTQLAEIQDHKGTPFEKFSEDLSTNEKPAFRALDQWEASISARFLFFAKPGDYQSNDNQPIERHFNATEVPIQGYLLTSNWIPIDIQSDANWCTNQLPIGHLLTSNLMPIWQPIWHQLRTNLKTIEIQSNTPQSNANRQPIWCHLGTNLKTIEIQCNTPQSNANRQPIWCQLRTNLKTIEPKSNVNWTPNKMLIDNQSDANWSLI